MLKRFYNHINKRFHNGELPPANIFFAPVSGDYGQVTLEDGVFVIRINPSEEGRPKSWKLAVIHEQIHVKFWPRKTHGKMFYDEVIRLVQAGAYRDLL